MLAPAGVVAGDGLNALLVLFCRLVGASHAHKLSWTVTDGLDNIHKPEKAIC